MELSKTITYENVLFPNEREYKVIIDISLSDLNRGQPYFTGTAKVWDMFYLMASGDCFDYINTSKLSEDVTFSEIYRLLKKYSSRDLYAGTGKQMKALWDKFGIDMPEYSEQCEYLKSIDLYEVKYYGKMYRFGTGWLRTDVSAGDLRKMKALFKDVE